MDVVLRAQPVTLVPAIWPLPALGIWKVLARMTHESQLTGRRLKTVGLQQRPHSACTMHRSTKSTHIVTDASRHLADVHALECTGT